MRIRAVIAVVLIGLFRPAVAQSPPQMPISDLLTSLREKFDDLQREPSLGLLIEIGRLTAQFTAQSNQIVNNARRKFFAGQLQIAREQIAGRGYKFVSGDDFGAQAIELLLSKTKFGITGRYTKTTGNRMQPAGEYLTFTTTVDDIYPIQLALITEKVPEGLRAVLTAVPETQAFVVDLEHSVGVVLIGTLVPCPAASKTPTFISGLCLQVEDGWKT
jgi:hypothetical protein